MLNRAYMYMASGASVAEVVASFLVPSERSAIITFIGASVGLAVYELRDDIYVVRNDRAAQKQSPARAIQPRPPGATLEAV